VYNVTNFILGVSCGVGGSSIKKKTDYIIVCVNSEFPPILHSRRIRNSTGNSV
jgi:hypothetical protein